jgi:hypothetical protein
MDRADKLFPPSPQVTSSSAVTATDTDINATMPLLRTPITGRVEGSRGMARRYQPDQAQTF